MGEIYVVDSEQGAMIKRLCYDPSSDDTVLLKSENPEYASFMLRKSEIRSLLLVIRSIKVE